MSSSSPLLALLAALVLAGAARPAPVPVLIDTDVGTDIDDALAVVLALASPELEVRGLTTVDGDAYTRAMILCRLLHFIGRPEVPVASGAGPRNPPAFDGQMQYGLRPAFRNRPVKADAVSFLYEKLKAEPGKLTLIALGPLTNVAALLTRHPDCKPWIKRLVVMGGALKVGYKGTAPAEPEWNVKTDIKSAQVVFSSGLPLVVAPLDATVALKLDGRRRRSVFAFGAAPNDQLRALAALWEGETPTLFDPAAVALVFDETPFTLEDLRLEVDTRGMTLVRPGKANARVATAVRRDDFLDGYVRCVKPARVGHPSTIPATNPSRPVERGAMPYRVHVLEDYETDIERRWWLCGRPETKDVGSGKRSCRGVPTNDFDERMGDPKATYNAVVFNPVPGPPLGKNTRLAFRCKLTGTDRLRVQIYSLTNGYHRHLTLTGLEQGRWLDLAVDMTQARRPDGSGGPLSENERIDDIQFYTDGAAELLIDDIALYDAAVPGEKRPFPARPRFCGWFDTGRHGQEWPGDFEIVPHRPPLTWKAARSVDDPKSGDPHLRVHLRGPRPLNDPPRLRLRYHLTGADQFRVVLADRTAPVREAKQDEWTEIDLTFPAGKESTAETLRFLLPHGARLLIDDVLLH